MRNTDNMVLCLDTANAFFDIGRYADKLNRDANQSSLLFRRDTFFAIPAIVNLAFACELYLKFLNLQEQSEFIDHSLLNLYNGLPKELQSRLCEEYKKRVDNESTFDSTIRVHKQAFERWRYIAENDNSTVEAYPTNLELVATILKEECENVKKNTNYSDKW